MTEAKLSPPYRLSRRDYLHGPTIRYALIDADGIERGEIHGGNVPREIVSILNERPTLLTRLEAAERAVDAAKALQIALNMVSKKERLYSREKLTFEALAMMAAQDVLDAALKQAGVE